MTKADELKQLHFTEITELIDLYSEEDKAFMLWYLMQKYIEDTKNQLPEIDVNNATTFAVTQMMNNHIKVAEEMREVLFYQWS